VSAVATCTIYPHGVLAAVGGGAVKADFATLAAVGRVGRPGGLVPSALEALRDLGKGEGEESKGEKSGLVEHGCGWIAVDSG